MKERDTLLESMQILQAKGYKDNLTLKFDCIECNDKNLQLKPNEFSIDDILRFEGKTNPADSSILYAISAPAKEVKGLLVNSYGAYSEPISDALMKKLQAQ